MALHVRALEVQDFDVLIRHADHYEPGDDLVAPPDNSPLVWPVSSREEAQVRASHCFSAARRRFLEDPSARWLGVIDDGLGGDFVAVARWHYYPDGYDFKRDGHWEMVSPEPAGPSLPGIFNRALHNHILTSRDSFREYWIPNGRPCWILTHLVTRPSQRRRGAAGVLIQWGMARAREMGITAYLEAGELGKPVYERFGWEQVGDMRKVNLREHGSTGDFVLVCMRWSPDERKTDAAQIEMASIA